MYDINRNLYNFIFDSLGAQFDMDHESVQSNLKNDSETNLKYLGTYFPRSYAESYKIFSNMIDEFLRWGYEFGDTINILDIGSGTGEQLFALLKVLSENLNGKRIIVYSVDGNPNALELQQKIFEYESGQLSNSIELITRRESFNKAEELFAYISQYTDIDILLSFKFLSELYINDTSSYRAMLDAAEVCLASNGLLTLVDLTDRLVFRNGARGEYKSIIFNTEVIKYMSEDRQPNERLFYAIPSCCSLHCCSCKANGCFTSIEMRIKYGSQNDFRPVPSKINYKLFIKDSGDFVDTLFAHGTYFINMDACDNCNVSEDNNVCLCSPEWEYEMYNPLKKCKFENSPFYIQIQ